VHTGKPAIKLTLKRDCQHVSFSQPVLPFLHSPTNCNKPDYPPSCLRPELGNHKAVTFSAVLQQLIATLMPEQGPLKKARDTEAFQHQPFPSWQPWLLVSPGGGASTTTGNYLLLATLATSLEQPRTSHPPPVKTTSEGPMLQKGGGDCASSPWWRDTSTSQGSSHTSTNSVLSFRLFHHTHSD